MTRCDTLRYDMLCYAAWLLHQLLDVGLTIMIIMMIHINSSNNGYSVSSSNNGCSVNSSNNGYSINSSNNGYSNY